MIANELTFKYEAYPDDSDKGIATFNYDNNVIYSSKDITFTGAMELHNVFRNLAKSVSSHIKFEICDKIMRM